MSGFRYPDVAGMQQLRQGDPNGGVNCTAYAGRGAGDADTRGALVFSGRAIRAATDEPRPDPRRQDSTCARSTRRCSV
jgi:hypothetical protein